MIKRLLMVTTAAVTAMLAGSATASTAGYRDQEPGVRYQGEAGQMITVVGADADATTAILTAWRRGPAGWVQEIGPMSAYVGSKGIGQASESTSRTPAGVWKLTESFGIQPNNGTRLPYRQVDTSDWWVSDTGSTLYNTYFRCALGTCPFRESAGENLGKAGPVYDHATVIDYNRNPAVPGAGSAFFLHISNGRPTAGCVSVPAGELDAIMRWLDPAQHPVINIGLQGHMPYLPVTGKPERRGGTVPTAVIRPRS